MGLQVGETFHKNEGSIFFSGSMTILLPCCKFVEDLVDFKVLIHLFYVKPIYYVADVDSPVTFLVGRY